MKTAWTPDPWYVEQERRIKEADRESARLRLEMRRTFDPGHLYVVEFAAGILKVGKSASPDRRLEQHAKAGLVRRTWVSAHHLGISRTEREVLAWCTEYGQLHGGREYFTELDFFAVTRHSMLVIDAAAFGEQVPA